MHASPWDRWASRSAAGSLNSTDAAARMELALPMCPSPATICSCRTSNHMKLDILLFHQAQSHLSCCNCMNVRSPNPCYSRKAISSGMQMCILINWRLVARLVPCHIILLINPYADVMSMSFMHNKLALSIYSSIKKKNTFCVYLFRQLLSLHSYICSVMLFLSYLNRFSPTLIYSFYVASERVSCFLNF